MSNDENILRVEVRVHGVVYGAEALRSGSTSIDRRGVWVANADWNGRALDAGDHELHHELDTSNTILEALADALAAESEARGGFLIRRKKDAARES